MSTDKSSQIGNSGFRHKLGELVVGEGLASKEQVEELLKESLAKGKPFPQFLTEKNIVSESKLTELLSKQFSIPMISLSSYKLDPEVIKLIPEKLARRYHVVPLSKSEGRLVVAMADPLNVVAMDDLKVFANVDIDPVLCPPSDLYQAIDQAYSNGISLNNTIEESQEEASTAGDVDTAVAMLLGGKDEADAPIVRVINLIIAEAVRARASDIHIEPEEDVLRVRFRIDGHLVAVHSVPKSAQNPLITRIKIMSGLDITEWRLPQDGRFKVKLDDMEVDFRVSILPLTQGGKIVLRLLDKANLVLDFEELGYLPETSSLFEEAVKRPYGLILLTGPTGSGKSTSLYAVLSRLNAVHSNLITIEDPVEYQVEGITQVQINPEVGLTFAGGLRSILRQNPDVVMVGEIRDGETADIAMKASLTGHLVLSTLHTNDAPSAITRLVDMGVEPFLVASSVSLVAAQRLVRKLCAKCREPFDPPEPLLKNLGVDQKKKQKFFKAVGCDKCHKIGFRGRLALTEVFVVDEGIRDLIVSNAPSWKVKEYAVSKLNMTTLRNDGIKKASMGLTTLEEVLSSTSGE